MGRRKFVHHREKYRFLLLPFDSETLPLNLSEKLEIGNSMKGTSTPPSASTTRRSGFLPPMTNCFSLALSHIDCLVQSTTDSPWTMRTQPSSLNLITGGHGTLREIFLPL